MWSISHRLASFSDHNCILETLLTSAIEGPHTKTAPTMWNFSNHCSPPHSLYYITLPRKTLNFLRLLPSLKRGQTMSSILLSWIIWITNSSPYITIRIQSAVLLQNGVRAWKKWQLVVWLFDIYIFFHIIIFFTKKKYRQQCIKHSKLEINFGTIWKKKKNSRS